MEWGIYWVVIGILCACVVGYAALIVKALCSLKKQKNERRVSVLTIYGEPETLERRVYEELTGFKEEEGILLLLDESGDPEVERLCYCLCKRRDDVHYFSDRETAERTVRELLVANPR